MVEGEVHLARIQEGAISNINPTTILIGASPFKSFRSPCCAVQYKSTLASYTVIEWTINKQ